MTAVLELNETDRFVRTEPGIMGDKLEAWLNERGFTLNHSPQSLDRSTPGGWVSTFATGQFSSKYGGIENLLLGLEVLLPDGSAVRTHLTPRTATGPGPGRAWVGRGCFRRGASAARPRPGTGLRSGGGSTSRRWPGPSGWPTPGSRAARPARP